VPGGELQIEVSGAPIILTEQSGGECETQRVVCGRETAGAIVPVAGLGGVGRGLGAAEGFTG
jgi:hypothetical protein